MSRWFRVYDDILDDPKVQLLPPELFKTWMNLLALASRNKGVLPTVATIAFALRISVQDAQSRLDELILAGLVDIRPDKLCEPHNWPVRQFASDSSAARMRKMREKRARDADVTSHVTPPDPEEEIELNPLPPEQVAAREPEIEPALPVTREGVRRLASLGLGRGGEPSIEAQRKVCRVLGIADAAPLVESYRDWALSRRAIDPDALFIRSASTIWRNAPAEVRARCQPQAPPDLGIVAKPVRASAELAASLTKTRRNAHAH